MKIRNPASEIFEFHMTSYVTMGLIQDIGVK